MNSRRSFLQKLAAPLLVLPFFIKGRFDDQD